MSREVVKLIASPLAVLIVKSSVDMKNSGEMRGCDETMLRISMEKNGQVCVGRRRWYREKIRRNNLKMKSEELKEKETY